MISLLDPATCGEDLALLASRMAEIAPALCVDCAEYHVRFSVTRCAAPDKSIATDRPLLIEHIGKIIRTAADRSDDIIQIVIAGAADAGVLATCAHAAAILGPKVLARCRFSLLDRCKSPLTLCAEFAQMHALALHTVQVELPSDLERFDADLIVAHSLLRFMDRSRQIAILKGFGRWLKPEGRIIISQSIRPGGQANFDKETARSRFRLAAAKAAVAAGALTIGDAALMLQENRSSGKAYEERPGEVASAPELRDLVSEAGLREYSLDIVAKDLPSAEGSTFERVRAVAVLGSSRGN